MESVRDDIPNKHARTVMSLFATTSRRCWEYHAMLGFVVEIRFVESRSGKAKVVANILGCLRTR